MIVFVVIWHSKQSVQTMTVGPSTLCVCVCMVHISCVRVCACACACVWCVCLWCVCLWCVCVCVFEWINESERESEEKRVNEWVFLCVFEREREREREIEREQARVCVCVHTCVLQMLRVVCVRTQMLYALSGCYMSSYQHLMLCL